MSRQTNIYKAQLMNLSKELYEWLVSFIKYAVKSMVLAVLVIGSMRWINSIFEISIIMQMVMLIAGAIILATGIIRFQEKAPA